MKEISENDLLSLVPDCCQLGFASINSYKGVEREHVCGMLSSVQTVIIIAHHVQDSLEWTWLKFPVARGGATSPADIHCLATVERIKLRLDCHDRQSFIIPYPGVSGPMFKTLALPTGLGGLGDNYLFMNEQWGTWIHLRAVLTDALIKFTPKQMSSGCTHCARCIEVCPAGAIALDTFNGIACRDAHKEMAKHECDGSYIYECEKCLRACPIGTHPKEIEVRFKNTPNSSEQLHAADGEGRRR